MAYNPDMSYRVTLGDKTYTVRGDLSESGDKTLLRCDIDGVRCQANVVVNGDSLHVFTMVGEENT